MKGKQVSGLLFSSHNFRQPPALERLEAAPARPVGRTLAVFWSVVVVKCVLVWVGFLWVPHPEGVHSAWVIVPTLLFAAVVTRYLLRRRL